MIQESPEFEELRDMFMAMEDELAAVFSGLDVKIPLYEFINEREQVYSHIKCYMVNGVTRRVRRPVAYLGYDGSCIYTEYKVENKIKRTDILEEDRVYVLVHAAKNLSKLYKRLKSDAAVPIEEMLAAVDQAKQWLNYMKRQEKSL